MDVIKERSFSLNTAQPQLLKSLNSLRDLICNIENKIITVGEDQTHSMINNAISDLSLIAYSNKESSLSIIRDYCNEHIAPVVLESGLAKMILKEKSNGSKGSYKVMESIWLSSTSLTEKNSGSTKRGELINAYNCSSDNARANISRIKYFTNLLLEYSKSDIAAISSGSAIEVRSTINTNDLNNEYDLFDHSDDACFQADKINENCEFSKLNVINGNPIKKILASNKKYDLIYSLGILDYIDNSSSEGLCKKLLSYLKPGGKLVVGNASPTSRTRLWIEMMGQWNLNYKTIDEMKIIGNSSDSNCKVITDEFDVYNFLIINKG
jgi:hypothetical protein